MTLWARRPPEAFVAALDTLANSGLVWVVATMRSDFFDRLETGAGLPLARVSQLARQVARGWSADSGAARLEETFGLRDDTLYNFAGWRYVVDQGTSLPGNDARDIEVASLPRRGVVARDLFRLGLQLVLATQPVMSPVDPLTVQMAGRWRTYALVNGLDAGRPTKADLWKCHIEGRPALSKAGEDSEPWRLFLEALAAHGYQAPPD